MINKDKTPIYKVFFGEKPITNTIVVENSNECEEPRLETLYITENGTYTPNEDIDGYNEVIVDVETEGNSKINLQETGLRIAYSEFTEVPEWVDFEGVTDVTNMFYNCKNLTTIPFFDISNSRSMQNMFYGCNKLTTIPEFNTSNVQNMYYMCCRCTSIKSIPPFNTSNVTNFGDMLDGCSSLQSLPLLDAGKVTNIGWFFGTTTISTLTDLGGFKNLKINWNDNYGLAKCPNLTYESIMNVINNLYDFVINGETTTRTLKINSNTYALLTDEDIAIATNKGWTISK